MDSCKGIHFHPKISFLLPTTFAFRKHLVRDTTNVPPSLAILPLRREIAVDIRTTYSFLRISPNHDLDHDPHDNGSDCPARTKEGFAFTTLSLDTLHLRWKLVR